MKAISLALLIFLVSSRSALAETTTPSSDTTNPACPGMLGGYGMPMMGTMRGGQMVVMPMMMGPHWGGGWAANQRALNLSATDVKAQMQRWMNWNGNRHLKVGKVAEKDANTITAEIVTQDNSLVQSFTVDRHSGLYTPSP